MKTESSEEVGLSSDKKSVGSFSTRRPVIPTRIYFASLRIVGVDSGYIAVDGAESEPRTQQYPTPVPKVVLRPPPIIVTASINLFKGKLKPLMKNSFEFRTTSNAIKVVTKDMTDYSVPVKSHTTFSIQNH
jgi:hypothetical protein